MATLRPQTSREESWTPENSTSVSETHNDASKQDSMTTTAPSDASINVALAGGLAKGDNGRGKSVQVTIEESGKTGRYLLRADDVEFRDILRAAIEREASLGGKARSRIRDHVFTRQFTTFDRQNPRASQSPFHGFFTLFWLAMALLLIRIAAQNYKDQGSVFGKAEILHLMVDRDLILLLVTDGLMCICSVVFCLALQKCIAKEYLTWDGAGWVVQSVWQMFFTAAFIWITFFRDWSWTHTVFIVMHDFILLMKQHSYSFYNGYLSRVSRRRTLLKEKLEQLEDMKGAKTLSPSSSSTTLTATGIDRDSRGLGHRRRSIGPKYSTDFHQEESEIASMAEAIEAGDPLDAEQIQAFHRILTTEITILEEELRGKCTTTSNCYPDNLTLYNITEWTCLPTLVYELEYPRDEHINWWYVAEKSAATLGVIWVMIIVSQAYLYPIIVETVRHKDAGMSLEQRWKDFPWVVFDMLFPLLLEQLLAWYVIWECLLNVLAEVTKFADRGFYGDWWNSVSWDQYARDWNRPVHSFLLRHVYHSSISAFHLSKTQATFVTFLLSAVVHEVLMFCLFKKVRGYLFALQLSQIPLAALSRTKLMKGRDTLGNITFWVGLFIGPSLITGLYLVV
ncbi:sterol o-acyltransferas-like protein 2 [Lentithecium fluviatile CBS 122367]|uniref:O-acyltransferase n=1 Tax=Lentithecium fluviatile CBS 122367 TaxID=1168545 RepID=A0A6G1JAR3_9PLEO|nr:sterol o-acyltransferas-like protein 2 [Lentithecium fluviatile CBS 122367]